MKREIVCADCDPKIKVKQYPGEGMKKVSGKIINPCICDACGTSIDSGDPGAAVSYYRTGQYYEWESEYVE